MKIFLGLILGAFLLNGVYVFAMQKESSKGDKEKMAHKSAYLLYENKCLDCHDSIADPERAGKTRDEWYVVVSIMHNYDFDLTEDEMELLTDYLFELRQEFALTTLLADGRVRLTVRAHGVMGTEVVLTLFGEDEARLRTAATEDLVVARTAQQVIRTRSAVEHIAQTIDNGEDSSS